MMHVTHDGTRWSNADADYVSIAEPDPSWPDRFAAEKKRIEATLEGHLGLRADDDYCIEHVGSTAVPGLAAKPIIDVLLIVPDRAVWAGLVDPFERLGYVCWAENPDPDHLFFVKGMPPYGERRMHHVHVRSPGPARRILRFRDYLRTHPQEAKRYERLKRRLARKHPTDREAYTEGKTEMIEEMLRRAKGVIGQQKYSARSAGKDERRQTKDDR